MKKDIEKALLHDFTYLWFLKNIRTDKNEGCKDQGRNEDKELLVKGHRSLVRAKNS